MIHLNRSSWRSPGIRGQVGWWLRCLADRIDYSMAPRVPGFSFTFERGEGIRWRQDGKGCPVLYQGDANYERAHSEADSNRAGEGVAP